MSSGSSERKALLEILVLHKGDLCYVSSLYKTYIDFAPRLAIYMHELPDAMIERHVVYVFSTRSIEYVTNVEVEAITITEL